MVASNAEWQLIITFSEWGEGTNVEPAVEWCSSSGYGQYLDVLHHNGSNPLSQPTQTPVATLNREIFYTIQEAKILIEHWRIEYNQVRLHSALRYWPPAPQPVETRPLTVTLLTGLAQGLT